MSESVDAAFLEQVQGLALSVAQTLNASLAEPETVMGLGLCAVQLNGRTTCTILDNGGKPVSAGVRMVTGVLSNCLEGEQNPRVRALLAKALRLSEEALRVRSGEIISTRLH